MEKMGICAVYPKPNLSKRSFKDGIVPYLLQNYVAQFPNHVWSIDISYIKMHKNHTMFTLFFSPPGPNSGGHDRPAGGRLFRPSPVGPLFYSVAVFILSLA